MSPIPRTGRMPQPDPVYGSVAAPPIDETAAEELSQSFPVDHVDPDFAEHMVPVDATGGPGSLDTAEVEPVLDDEEPEMRVTDHLEAAVRAAEAEGMPASELIGLFFYYAHSLAEEGRQAALQGVDGASG